MLMSTMVKVLICVGLGLVLAALCFWFLVYNKPHTDIKKAKAEYIIGAEQLYSVFRNNKDSSNSKYNGRVIEISGSLTKVEVTDSLVVAIFVYEQGTFGDQGVRCTMLPEFSEQIKSAQAESFIKLKGFCAGFNDMDVIFDKVSIVEQ